MDMNLSLDPTDKKISPMFAEVLRKVTYGSGERVGYADLSPAQQIQADVASYSEELFYLRLGTKAPIMLDDFNRKVIATNGHLKNNSCLTPEEAMQLVLGLGEDVDIEDNHFQQRITRLFRILVHPEELVSPYAFVSMQGFIESPEDQWQFFFLFADIDEDFKVSFSDMQISARMVIDFTLRAGHTCPELMAYTQLTEGEKDIGLQYFIRRSFDAPLDEQKFKEWFEASTLQAPMEQSVIVPPMDETSGMVSLGELQEMKQQSAEAQKEEADERGPDLIEAF